MTKFIKRNYIAQEFAQRQDTFFRRFMTRSIALPIILLVIVVFTGFAYIFYINQTATGSFDIKSLESKINQLQDTNKKLQLQAADMQSLSAVEASVQDLQMVAVSQVQYLPAVGSAVAVR